MREVWVARSLVALKQDIRYGFRSLHRSPVFAALLVLTLGLGVGVNTAIFAVVNAVLLRPLPYPDPDRLVQIWSMNVKKGIPRMGLSLADAAEIAARGQVFSRLATYRGSAMGLSVGDGPEEVTVTRVSPDFFQVLGVQPAIGRAFVPVEGRPGHDQVVVLSHSLWRGRLKGDPDAIGRTLTLGGKVYTVVGITPEGFEFPARSQAWVPLEPTAEELVNRRVRGVLALARLKPRITVREAQAQLRAIAGSLEQAFPGDRGWGLTAFHLQEELVGNVRQPLLLLLGAAGLVLAIASVNVANLSLARGVARRKEIAVRQALGASRLAVVRQLLVEGLILALAGGAAGTLIGRSGLGLLRAFGPSDLPHFNEMKIDLRVVGFSLALSVLGAGLAGAFSAVRSSKHSLISSLREGGEALPAGHSLAPRYRAQHVLVVAEVGLSLVLTVAAGLMIKSLWRLLNADMGFDPHNILTLSVPLSRAKYASDEQQTAFFAALIERVTALPGVMSAAVGPVLGAHAATAFTIGGSQSAPEEALRMSLLASVTPGYFSTLRIALLEGRDFSKQDTARAPKVCIISAPMARRFWPAQDPLGYRVKLGGGTDAVPAEIVGVVAETRGYQAAPEGFEVYVPYPQMPSVENSLVLRTASDPLGLAAAVRAQVWALDGDQPVAEVATLEQALSESFQEPRLQAVLLSAFAALALILALVGIYGVVSYTLRQRTHEIGVRMALGAESAHILRMVIKEALALTLVGLAVGLTVALGLVRLLRSVLYVAPTGAADLLSYGNRGFFYGLKPTDPAVFVLVLSILAGVALLAAYLPARRASTVDPMVALRQE